MSYYHMKSKCQRHTTYLTKTYDKCTLTTGKLEGGVGGFAGKGSWKGILLFVHPSG